MKTNLVVLFFVTLMSMYSCRNDDDILEEMATEAAEEAAAAEAARVELDIPDWTTETHSDSVEPNYSVVFNQDEVLRFDIQIESSDWSTMQDNLSDNLSSASNRPGVVTDSDYDLVWVPCTFTYDDTEWYQVGVRFKGNSSLSSTYQSGIKKFSFKLDFEQFESDYTNIDDQRFYGFKQLNLKNNYNDGSLMREKVGSDLFYDFGVPSPQTSFCVVYVDYGSGPIYYGVYTLVEEVDDTVIETQFSDGTGNLYKPDGDAATFAWGSYDEGELEKKTNLEAADYSDAYSLYTTLNDSERTTDTELWMSNLSDVLDVDNFLKWLAANVVLQNWDTYGNMTHNYYLYNNPENSLLTWIPWDNNEALQDGKSTGALSFDLSRVSSSWPLISYLMDQGEYEDTYEAYMQDFAESVFTVDRMTDLYSEYYTLLKEYAYAESGSYTFLSGDSEFDSSVETLKDHVEDRNTSLRNYLD